MTTAGELRETVALQRAATVPDGAGGFVRTWTTYATRRAQVLPARGHEIFDNDVVQGVQTYLITIRSGQNVLPSDRLVWRGTTMNIRAAADPDGRRAWTLITADAGVVVD